MPWGRAESPSLRRRTRRRQAHARSPRCTAASLRARAKPSSWPADRTTAGAQPSSHRGRSGCFARQTAACAPGPTSSRRSRAGHPAPGQSAPSRTEGRRCPLARGRRGHTRGCNSGRPRTRSCAAGFARDSSAHRQIRSPSNGRRGRVPGPTRVHSDPLPNDGARSLPTRTVRVCGLPTRA
jgi:hypothetical protein